MTRKWHLVNVYDKLFHGLEGHIAFFFVPFSPNKISDTQHKNRVRQADAARVLQNAWTTDGQLEALAPHRLDQNTHLQFPASPDLVARQSVTKMR